MTNAPPDTLQSLEDSVPGSFQPLETNRRDGFQALETFPSVPSNHWRHTATMPGFPARCRMPAHRLPDVTGSHPTTPRIFPKTSRICPKTPLSLPKTPLIVPITSIGCPITPVIVPTTSLIIPISSRVCQITSGIVPKTSHVCSETSQGCPKPSNPWEIRENSLLSASQTRPKHPHRCPNPSPRVLSRRDTPPGLQITPPTVRCGEPAP